jgi:CRISPR system Cascade subunit CasC
MKSPFLQIHTLISYPAVLLNRDDAGFAKRIPFGGVTRTRISSQCLKRHWRTYEGTGSLNDIDGAEISVRSRLSFAKFVLEPLIDDGVDQPKAAAVVQSLMAEVLGESAKAKSTKEAEVETSVQTNQITVLGRPELSFLLEQARAICGQIEDPSGADKAVKEHFSKDAKKNLKGLKMAAGLGAALFGRMVTSDILARADASVHVAHAFTVHAEASESDFFSAVDDLTAAEGEMGSGHISNVELNSGLFYEYLAVDVPLLVSNLVGCGRDEWQEADRGLAAEVLKRLVSIVATVSPGAKLGSTAPHSYAQMMLIEAGYTQPRTLANAFLKPVREVPDLLKNAYMALGSHLADLDHAYGAKTERSFLALGPFAALDLGERKTLDELAEWASGKVKER